MTPRPYPRLYRLYATAGGPAGSITYLRPERKPIIWDRPSGPVHVNVDLATKSGILSAVGRRCAKRNSALVVYSGDHTNANES
jgi:hypothetical protein